MNKAMLAELKERVKANREKEMKRAYIKEKGPQRNMLSDLQYHIRLCK